MPVIDVSGDGGVLKEVTREGTGPRVEQGMTVFAHYTGTLASTGAQFDSSVGKPHRVNGFDFEVGAGAVIKGWDLGFGSMRVGEKATLTLSPAYGYGSHAMGDAIPANSTLVFDVEVLDARFLTQEEKEAVWAETERLRGR
jgi:FKBP-type peptidyl-prolyl cis-trans isomerase